MGFFLRPGASTFSGFLLFAACTAGCNYGGTAEEVFAYFVPDVGVESAEGGDGSGDAGGDAAGEAGEEGLGSFDDGGASDAEGDTADGGMEGATTLSEDRGGDAGAALGDAGVTDGADSGSVDALQGAREGGARSSDAGPCPPYPIEVCLTLYPVHCCIPGPLCSLASDCGGL